MRLLLLGLALAPVSALSTNHPGRAVLFGSTPILGGEDATCPLPAWCNGNAPVLTASDCSMETLPGSTQQSCVIKNGCFTVSGTMSMGYINVHSKGTLIFSDASDVTLTAKSILVEQGGYLFAGCAAVPFGANTGSRLEIVLSGTVADDPIACLSQAGAPGDCFPTGLSGNTYCASAGDPDDPCQATSGSDSALFEAEVGAVSTGGGKYPVLHSAQGQFGRKVLAISYGGHVRLYGAEGVAESVKNAIAESDGPACQFPLPTAQNPSKYSYSVIADDWAQMSGSSWARLDATLMPIGKVCGATPHIYLSIYLSIYIYIYTYIHIDIDRYIYV